MRHTRFKLHDCDRKGAVIAKSPDLLFYLNGQRTELHDVAPTALLVDYLRSAEVGLTGTKIGCKQGGCGACTVLLSTFDAAAQQVRHRSVNACLRPLASLDGALITTVEGLGSVTGKVSPLQYCLAKNNGTQCGYCTPGWVMSAHGYLAARGVESLTFDTTTDRMHLDRHDPSFEKLPTKQELQARFDGNLCRCTGYRPILFGFEKGFAKDWTAADADGCMTCDVDPAEGVTVSDTITPRFPDALRVPARAVRYERNGYTWIRPLTLAVLKSAIDECPDGSEHKLVFGNTSIGVYDKYTEDPHWLIDIAHIAELRATGSDSHGLVVGSAVTYNDFLDLLDAQIAVARVGVPERLAGLTALHYMARRTAGAIVRDAASLGGNTMLVLRHILSGAPFPSDLFTALAAVGTEVMVWDFASGQEQRHELLDFARIYASSPDRRSRCLLLGYRIPFTAVRTFAQTYKTALREVNAHSIVNAGFTVRFTTGNIVAEATFVIGGIGPVAVALPSVAGAILGRAWDWTTHEAAREAIIAAVNALFAAYGDRLKDLPWEGFTNDYKRELAVAYLYKFFVSVALAVNPSIITPEARSACERKDRPVSRGTQNYSTFVEEFPVNQPFIKLEAFLQATGEAMYPQDLPLPPRGLQAALVMSQRARASFSYALPDRSPASPAKVLAHLRERFHGVVGYLTSDDLPSGAWRGLAGDQPIFATNGLVLSHGQAIGLVLALEEEIARDAANLVSTQLVQYDNDEPVLTIPEAIAANSIFTDNPGSASWYSHIWKITRPGTEPHWSTTSGSGRELDHVACRLVRGAQNVGGQIHFYMETQTCLAEPGEEQQMLVRPSAQDPDSVQGAVAATLGVPENKVDVRIKRVGGGYGGKTSQAPFVAAAAALAAQKWNRPVRLAVKRETDTAMFGHRHPGQASYVVAIGDGTDSVANKGRLVGLQLDVLLNGGFSYDTSFIVMDCLQLRVDSAYFVPNYGTSGDVCRTNLASNNAFRTMGLIQGILMLEEAIEAAAHAIDMLPEDVRARSLYQAGQQTPFGQPLDSCYMQRVFDFTRATFTFDARLSVVHAFNAANQWRKRGISLIPVKYASGYNNTVLEQAGALVEVFDQDGSLIVRTGGVEMGQGLNTKIAQIASLALNVPLVLIRVAELDTGVVPNPSSTGASTGTAFNGAAVLEACTELRQRLEAYATGLRQQHSDQWCATNGLNYWDFSNGWQATAPPGPGRDPSYIWANLVSIAFNDRINLSAQVRTAVPGGTAVDSEGLAYHAGATSAPPNHFTGFTYSAAIAEVEIDVLTGETMVLRADIVYDMGNSLNPAIDVGQIEGAFVQGIGYVMSEELVYQPDGPLKGQLNTLNTWTYKPPAAMSIPLEMNVDFFPFPEDAKEPNLLLSSKEVGEPPMTLAATVFFAIKHAVLAARKDQGDHGWFALDAPATVQRIAAACRVASPSGPGA